MRIVAKSEIGKLVSLLERIQKEYVAKFRPSRLYPQYMYWNAAGTEQSAMYQTIYATPALLAEAEKLLSEPAL
jgi:hypothetical protein